MGAEGLILAATDWSKNAQRAVYRAAYIGAQCGARGGVLMHTAGRGWLARLTGAAGGDAVRRRTWRLAQLARSVHEKTGFAFDAETHGGDIVADFAHRSGASKVNLIALGHESNAWFDNGIARRLLPRSRGPVLIVKREPETAYRRVLVAVDCDEGAIDCIAQARALAPEADMIVVHAIDHALENRLKYADVRDDAIRDIRMQHHEQAFDRLNTLLSEAGIAPGHVVKIVEHAYAPRLILDKERDFLVDLIVIGRSSASWLRRLFFRGVTSQVLAQAHADVLVVPVIKPPD